MVHSTCQTINLNLGDLFAPATVEAAEVDFNGDGKPDVITFTANINSGFPIHGVRALLQFQYQYTVSS